MACLTQKLMRRRGKRGVGGLLIIAGLVIGIGIGLYIDETAAGTLIGLGAGLVAAFIAGMMKKKRGMIGRR